MPVSYTLTMKWLLAKLWSKEHSLVSKLNYVDFIKGSISLSQGFFQKKILLIYTMDLIIDSLITVNQDLINTSTFEKTTVYNLKIMASNNRGRSKLVMRSTLVKS